VLPTKALVTLLDKDNSFLLSDFQKKYFTNSSHNNLVPRTFFVLLNLDIVAKNSLSTIDEKSHYNVQDEG